MNAQPQKTKWKYGTRAYANGEIVFREGDMGAEAYIVESGTLEIRKSVDNDPDRLVLGTLTKGAIFGEMALVDNCPRMASAVCIEPVELRVIPVDVFEMKLQQTDPFIRALLRVLVRNARTNVSASVQE